VDSSIAPVSLSHPSAAARKVLDRCGVGWIGGTLQIVGMGLVPHARDLPKYVRIPAYDIEIQNDDPMWVVEFQGEMPQTLHASPAGSGPTDVAWVDPICIVSAHDSGFLGVGPLKMSDGSVVQPLPAAPPIRSLPPPLP
jgi:hypothetical protein